MGWPSQRYRTSEDIAEEKRLKEEYAAKMKDGFSVLKHQLWYKTEDELRDTFYETDPDHSGQIDDRELKSFFAALAVSVRPCPPRTCLNLNSVSPSRSMGLY